MATLTSSTPTIVGFGEAMIRYAPVDKTVPQNGQPDLFLRSIGGDELNVMVALSRLGRHTHWVSLLPNNVLGNVVRNCATSAGVSIKHCLTDDTTGEVGSFTVIPEEKRVHYRRKSSSFWKQSGDELKWEHIMKDCSAAWCHATGISPLCGSGARTSWEEHLRVCEQMKIPVSIDFNHRAALGTLKELWDIVHPIIAKSTTMKLLIFSLVNLRGVAALCGLENLPGPSYFEMAGGTAAKSTVERGTKRLKTFKGQGTAEDDPVWVDLMQRVYNYLKGKVAIACCFKTRDGSFTNLQTRWSVIVDGNGAHSTRQTPTVHVPKDECGGGSAWAAGCIDAYLEAAQQGVAVNGAMVARRGDLMAALCQETVGDHSWVTRSNLDCALSEFQNKVAILRPGGENFSSSSLAPAVGASMNVASLHRELLLDLNPVSWLLKKQIEENLPKMPRLIAIVRAKRADLAIQRSLELVEMGCRAIEITFDTTDFERVLSTVVRRVGKKALVGVGTAMKVEDVRVAASLGAKFALSPINPPGFSAECIRLGLIAVPAAFTPNEVWQAHNEGAHFVKLFPAYLWQPKALKAMLGTGPLKNVKIMPSGGISPDTAKDWFDAGAVGVGMGSALCGKDITTPAGEDYEEQFKTAKKSWAEHGKAAAQTALDTLQ
jgi:Entner-Doudoroff aldolase